MKRTKIISACLLVSSIVLAASACSSVDATSEPSSEAAVGSLTIATFNHASTTVPYYIATKRGIFEKNGVKVELIPTTGASNSVSLLAGKNTDIAVGQANNFMDLAGSGVGLKVLGGWQSNNLSVWALDSLKGDNAGKPYPQAIKDLRGKTVGITAPGSLTDVLLRQMIEDAGLKVGVDISIVAVGAGAAQVAAMKNGDVQATVVYKDAGPVLESMGAPKLYLLATSEDGSFGDVENLAMNVAMVRTETAETKKEALTVYCKSIAEVMDWMKDPANSTEYLRYAGEWMKVSDDVLKKAYTAWPKLQHNSMTAEVWNAQADYYPKSPPLDWEDVRFKPCEGL